MKMQLYLNNCRVIEREVMINETLYKSLPLRQRVELIEHIIEQHRIDLTARYWSVIKTSKSYLICVVEYPKPVSRSIKKLMLKK